MPVLSRSYRSAVVRPLVVMALTVFAVYGPRADLLSAQRLTIRVVDSTGGEPISGAMVRFADTLGNVMAEGQTNGAGELTGTVYATEWLVLAVVRIGYQPIAGRRVLVSADAPTTATMAMVPVAATLPTLEVVATASSEYLRRAGFYERARLGFGYFIDPRSIDERSRSAPTIGHLFATIPGVTLLEFGTGRIGSVVRVTGMSSIGRACQLPRVFVDGLLIISSHDPPEEAVGQLEQVVSPRDVLAIEVYRRPAEVPAQWSGSDSGCGVILIWSKSGARQ